jgi:hypothetical protein
MPEGRKASQSPAPVQLAPRLRQAWCSLLAPGKFSPHGLQPDIRTAALRQLAAIFAAIMQAINTGTVLYAPILEFIVDACIFAHMGRLLSILKNRKRGKLHCI